ncbi:MAG TPA: hypothetical protein VJM34_10710 [Novosphingobium sp.]|nr:hypothetical protein [Novosphingobium sp.]
MIVNPQDFQLLLSWLQMPELLRRERFTGCSEEKVFSVEAGSDSS